MHTYAGVIIPAVKREFFVLKLWFEGHEYRYAVEQMLSTLFPGEKPLYLEDGPDGDGMKIVLRKGKVYTTASCVWHRGQEVFRGRSAVRSALLTDSTQTDRFCQFAIKNAVYRAVLASGIGRPPWGALTGVRPGKIMHGIIEQSADREQAVARFMKEYDVTEARAQLCYETSMCTHVARESLKDSDICLYVGIPFCPTRCAYCSFVSQSVEKSMKLIEPFLEALEKEIKATAQRVRECALRPVSIYMGGGTPTTLSASQLDRLCTLLEEEFDLSAVKEYCVEAGRPDTITEEKLETLKKHGVNRISVNPQTMDDGVLEAIGRRHTAQDICTAMEKARKIGGFAINMDIIAGLPTDTPEGFEQTIRRVLALEPENITVHTLSLKRGSGLMTGGEEIPSAAEVAKMLDGAYAMLREKRYLPYYLYRQKNMSGGFENTGWTANGFANLYNICMMEEICGILAMGGGGSTKLIRPEGGRNLRITAPKYPLEYIEQIEKTCADKEKITLFYTAEDKTEQNNG